MSTIHMSHNFVERSFSFLELLRDVPPRCQNRGARRGSPLPAGGGTSAGLSGGEGPGESCAPTELLSPARDGPRQPGHVGSSGGDGGGVGRPWRVVVGSSGEHLGARAHPQGCLARPKVVCGLLATCAGGMPWR